MEKQEKQKMVNIYYCPSVKINQNSYNHLSSDNSVAFIAGKRNQFLTVARDHSSSQIKTFLKTSNTNS